MEILVATHNIHKKQEIQEILGTSFLVTSLSDYHLNQEIEENGATFQENAKIKALFSFGKTKKASLGDDSGLVISALGGQPGIFSARYAGAHDFKANINKVLHEMKGVEDRSAYFITVMCLADEQGLHYFEGRIYGRIATEIKGAEGFGYDPIFIPENSLLSFAEMNPDEKNRISHRAKAIQLFLTFLNTQQHEGTGTHQ